MAITLYCHPLSSYCWKALIALYEARVDFTPRLVDLSDAADRAAFASVWPLAKFPVLQDGDRNQTVPESSIIVEYLAATFPQGSALIPHDAQAARDTRLRDRLLDAYVHTPMQAVVSDRLRPAESRDPLAVDQAKALIRNGYAVLEPMTPAQGWAMGDVFTLADCSALPALFYADYAVSLAEHPRLAAYLNRLKTRPSVERVLAEAEPFLNYFPLLNG